MTIIDEFLADAKEHMAKSVDATRTKFSTVRAGRASPSLLDRVVVDYYGTQTPLRQLATINAPEARLITIQPYDKSAMKAIERSIQESDLGLTPNNDGAIIRLQIPEMTEERRRDMVKVARRSPRRAASRSATSAATRCRTSASCGSPATPARTTSTAPRKRCRSSPTQQIGEIDSALKAKEAEILEV